MTQVQEFGSPQEALAHYGVKGMKWGVRKADAPSNSDIRDARTRVMVENRQFQKSSKAIKKDKSISRAERKEAIGDLRVSALANPDRMTALRMTTGEKAALAALAVVAPPSAVGVAVTRTAVRRQLESAQVQQRLKDKAR